MFIDYVTLMLVNMAAGLVTLAWFLWSDIDKPQVGKWAPAFAIPGVVGMVCGFAMTFTWPIPKPYSTAYGETTVMLGALFMGAAWCLAKEWDITPLGIYSFFAGLAGVLIGIRIINLGLTQSPVLSGIGFILTGFGGVMAGFILTHRQNILLRRLGSMVLVVASLIWVMTAGMAYWYHLLPPAK